MQIPSQIKYLWMLWGAFSLGGVACAQSVDNPITRLETSVVQWVAKQQSLPSSDVVMLPLDPRMKVQSCEENLTTDFPFSSAETVRVRCKKPTWQLYVQVSLPQSHSRVMPAGANSNAPIKPGMTRQVWVVEQHISVGSPIGKQQLKLMNMDAASVGPAALDAQHDINFVEAVRELPAGSIVRQHDLRPLVLVKRGQIVQIAIGKGQGFMIAAKVEALQDGRFGEQIKLKNPESGRTLMGVVRGPGSVEGS